MEMIAERDTDDNKTLLHWAADRGDQTVTKRCLDLGAKIDDTDRYGRTPLHLAATNGHLKVVKILVEANANKTIRDNYGRTALHCAQGFGSNDRASHPIVIRYLRD